jgi:hypothetical protein
MSRLDREAAISMTEITHSWPRRQGIQCVGKGRENMSNAAIIVSIAR